MISSAADDARLQSLYRRAQTLYERIHRTGAGNVSDVAEVHVSADGGHVVFTGSMMSSLSEAPLTRVCSIDLHSAQMRVLTSGPRTDRSPKLSPDGRDLAFLSDRHRAADFQLYLRQMSSGAVKRTMPVEGWVEYLSWSPDGRRILLGVAGYGADTASTKGAVVSELAERDLPSWMPTVSTGREAHRWRHVWIYDLASDSVRRVSGDGMNIWEAAWCGNDSVVVSASPDPGEGAWYSACLYSIRVDGNQHEKIYTPEDQLGGLSGSPGGAHLAFIEAVCSDRMLVFGELRIVDRATGSVRRIDTDGVNVSTTQWRSDKRLLLAGLRGFETVVGIYDTSSGKFEETWRSSQISSAGSYICVAGMGSTGDCVILSEGFDRSPEIGAIRDGEYRTIKSFDSGYSDEARCIAGLDRLTWEAPDALEIQGWLLRPRGDAPHATVMAVHGGPVSNWRPAWLGRPRTLPFLMLLQLGYAVFLPNPRGSSGRGQDFARRVRGDMGGADTHDLLSGVDHIVARGFADANRLGVTGISYGGFMTAWLITHSDRFKAAVPVAMVANRVSQRLTCTHTRFIDLFLEDTYNNAQGKYYGRSPIMYAHRAGTPTLNVCGALDKCTPPAEALQFHNALLEAGVRSALVTYPQEGHGVRGFPASIDYAARLAGWFVAHL
ncbi:MAG TPA: prolyl oligopeptidase family serine peptidase [Steroidobacter sp.]|uniref:S9 family peptidase n=1 Tax=Steroidobacter sp. TaxID=1978227 RepID=UPI002EDA8774